MKIYSGIWKIQAKTLKNGFWPKMAKFLSQIIKISPKQNFPGIWSMIFSKRTIKTTSIPKIRKIHSGVWKLKAKNLQNCQFWPKSGQILAISEFSRHIHYHFLKEDHKGSFHTKNYENLQRRLEDIDQGFYSEQDREPAAGYRNRVN